MTRQVTETCDLNQTLNEIGYRLIDQCFFSGKLVIAAENKDGNAVILQANLMDIPLKKVNFILRDVSCPNTDAPPAKACHTESDARSAKKQCPTCSHEIMTPNYCDYCAMSLGSKD